MPSCCEITEENFDRCVAINLKSCILACKHVIPIMRQQKSDAIVNISSMAGDHHLLLRRLQGDQVGDGGPSQNSSPTRTPSTASAPTSSCPA